MYSWLDHNSSSIISIQLVIQEVLKLLSTETSHKVCSQLINTLSQLGTLILHDNPLLGKIIDVAYNVTLFSHLK